MISHFRRTSVFHAPNSKNTLAFSPMSDVSDVSNIITESDEAVESRYVFGYLPRVSFNFPTLLVASPTVDGWRVRSTERSYNHDYVCYETFEEVMEWLHVDLRRPFICKDRAEAIHVMTTSKDTSTGFLLPGGCSSVHEEVDVVLRHLETCYGVA